MLLDIVDDRNWDQIADAHLASQKEADFGAANVVLNELLNHIDIVLPRLQGRQRFVNICSTALDNERLDEAKRG